MVSQIRISVYHCIPDAPSRELQSHGLPVCHSGDRIHGAQHRRHEKVLRCTLLDSGAESVVLVIRCCCVLLLHRICWHSRISVPVATWLVHMGPDRIGSIHRAERSGAGDEGAEDRERRQSIGHQIARYHPGVRDPGLSLQGQADIDQRVRRGPHHLLCRLHGLREGDLFHLWLYSLVSERSFRIRNPMNHVAGGLWETRFPEIREDDTILVGTSLGTLLLQEDIIYASNRNWFEKSSISHEFTRASSSHLILNVQATTWHQISFVQ